MQSILALTPLSCNHKKMKFVLLLSCLLFFLSGCGGEADRELNDPNQQISFAIPGGWEVLPNSNGTRFQASTQENADEPQGAIIMVNTLLVDEPRDLKRQRDAWIEYHESRGLAIVLNSTYQANGVTGIEFANEQIGSMGKEILHQIQFHYPGVLVVTHLQVPVDGYEAILPAYHKVVDSIRPTSR